MKETTQRQTPVNWWLILSAATFTAILFSLLAIFSSDITELLLFPGIGILIGFTGLLVIAFTARRKGRAFSTFALMLVAYGGVSFVCLMHRKTIRDSGRWLLWSRSYKAELMRQQKPSNGGFRHMEWDGWGWAGAGDTVEYLVFDPKDSLSAAASRTKGKLNGLPCEVPTVHRLESQWYAVVFYTDYDWDHCS